MTALALLAFVPFAVITAALGMVLALVFGPLALWLGVGIAIGAPAIVLGSRISTRRTLASDENGSPPGPIA
jgi:hypothetical protein